MGLGILIGGELALIKYAARGGSDFLFSGGCLCAVSLLDLIGQCLVLIDKILPLVDKMIPLRAWHRFAFELGVYLFDIEG